jgi:hypothetical protein
MKTIYAALLCFLTHTAFAQDSWYVQPCVGFGISNLKQNIVPSGNYKPVLAFDAAIGVGYRRGALEFASGVSFMRTGARTPLTFEDANGMALFTSDFHFYFYHAVIPLTVGYRVLIADKFTFLPRVGVDITYNTGAKETLVGYPGTDSGKLVSIPSAMFDASFHRFSVFGMVQAGLAYKVSPKIEITGGPSFQYMLTNMFKTQPSAPLSPVQHNYALLMDAGLRWYFTGAAKGGGAVSGDR